MNSVQTSTSVRARVNEIDASMKPHTSAKAHHSTSTAPQRSSVRALEKGMNASFKPLTSTKAHRLTSTAPQNSAAFGPMSPFRSQQLSRFAQPTPQALYSEVESPKFPIKPNASRYAFHYTPIQSAFLSAANPTEWQKREDALDVVAHAHEHSPKQVTQARRTISGYDNNNFNLLKTSKTVLEMEELQREHDSLTAETARLKPEETVAKQAKEAKELQRRQAMEGLEVRRKQAKEVLAADKEVRRQQARKAKEAEEVLAAEKEVRKEVLEAQKIGEYQSKALAPRQASDKRHATVRRPPTQASTAKSIRSSAKSIRSSVRSAREQKGREVKERAGSTQNGSGKRCRIELAKRRNFRPKQPREVCCSRRKRDGVLVCRKRWL